MSKLARRIRIPHQTAVAWGSEQFELIKGLIKEAIEREVGEPFVWRPEINCDSYELVAEADIKEPAPAPPFARVDFYRGRTLVQYTPGDRLRLLAEALTLVDHLRSAPQVSFVQIVEVDEVKT